MSEKIYYLAHPYSNDPRRSFLNAVDWTYRLRYKEHLIFSPILHTHNFHEKMGDFMDLVLLNDEMDYVAWDLKILDALRAGDGRMRHQSVPFCNQCQMIRDPNTRLGWHCSQCKNPFDVARLNEGKWKWKNIDDITYDSRAVMLLSRTAYDLTDWKLSLGEFYIYCQNDPSGQGKELWQSIWLSTGCRREYEFAKEHHIRVLELEAFLEGSEVEL